MGQTKKGAFSLDTVWPGDSPAPDKGVHVRDFLLLYFGLNFPTIKGSGDGSRCLNNHAAITSSSA